MTATSIAHLRIKLDDVEPPVVRRVEVPLTIYLDRLHLVLQAAMGVAGSRFHWRSQWNSQRRVDQQPSLRNPCPQHWLGPA